MIRFFLFLFLILLPSSLKADSYEFVGMNNPCGIFNDHERRCGPGLACRNVINAAGYQSALGYSGVCAPTGVPLLMCKLIKETRGNQNDFLMGNTIFQRMALFSFVMLGFAFFLGKISWGMILTLIMGIVLIVGAENLLSWVVDSNSGGWFTDKCSTIQNISKCALEGVIVQPNTKEIFGALYDQVSFTDGEKIDDCQKRNSTNCKAYKTRKWIVNQGTFNLTKTVSTPDGKGGTVDKDEVRSIPYKYCTIASEGNNFYIFSENFSESVKKIQKAMCDYDNQSYKDITNIEVRDKIKFITSTNFPAELAQFNKNYDYFNCKVTCTGAYSLILVNAGEKKLCSELI
jgi:hypothetical protein